MKNHVKIYLKYIQDELGLYPEDSFCECCWDKDRWNKAVDIHHIEARGMGGTTKPDVIENLMGLCRYCHERMGDKEQYMAYLKRVHKKFIGTYRSPFFNQKG